jgi:hypothetical protein
MKLPFTRSTDTSLAAAREALGVAEAKIAELETARAGQLLESDDLRDVQRIDADLQAQRHAASIYRDRIAGLTDQRRKEERANREAEKTAALIEIGKRLARRDNASRLVETKSNELSAGVTELLAADAAVFADWPLILPTPNHFSYLSVSAMLPLCKRDRRASDFEPRVIVGPARAIADGAADGLAEEIRQKGVDLIEMLEALELPEEEFPDDEAEVAAA